MTNDIEQQAAQRSEDDDPQHGPEVTITINNEPYQVHRGRQTVTYLKGIAGIAQSFELDELEDGRLAPLADDGSVTIKGGEEFKSNLKVGHSA
ncbi:MAG TPA: hypothetical protein VJO13_15545 [Ktedonobacterales bacterium]|nr:hypothetical protein [Ktedonobacterales bacterium]